MAQLPRDDEILMDLENQSIKDTFNLKKSVTLKSVRGSIKADIVPSPAPSSLLTRKFETWTEYGSQHCTVSTSLGPLLLESSHTTTYGSMKLVYPEDWRGVIRIFTTHASYDIREAVVVRDVVDPGTKIREVIALRGNPREGEQFSTMKIETKHGAVALRFEKKPPLRDMTEEEAAAEQAEQPRGKGQDLPPSYEES